MVNEQFDIVPAKVRVLRHIRGKYTDGYSGYAPPVRECDLVRLACWAHARRGFVDVLKSLGLNAKKLPANPPAKARRALYALQQIQTLYAIERRIRDEPPEERRRVRQAESIPMLDALRACSTPPWPGSRLRVRWARR